MQLRRCALDLIAPALAVEAAPAPAPLRNGFLLAWLVMIGMVLALGYTAVRLRRAQQGRIQNRPPAWLGIYLPLLAAAGLGVAAYLCFVETQEVLPSAVLSATAMRCKPAHTPICSVCRSACWGWSATSRSSSPGVAAAAGDQRAALALPALTGFGVLFSIYLTYLELFVIAAVCAWCLSSAVIMALLLVVSVETAVSRLQPSTLQSQRRQ
jgi:hypothetical protein